MNKPQNSLELVEMWQRHPAQSIRLDLEDPSDESLGRWWVACCLLGQRCPAERLPRLVEELTQAKLSYPAQIQAAGASALLNILAAQEVSDPERVAALLLRGSHTLMDDYEGSFNRLGHGAENLEDLARRLSGLTPGFGRASIVRFLQPLREHWPAASELPLDPAARAAAEHLGWIPPGADEDGAPSALRGFLRDEATAPVFEAVEFALAQLGRRACLRERKDRCPLGEGCALQERDE